MTALRQTTKRLGGQIVINDLTLELNGHPITALVGASGCGKSTLLRILAGLIACDQGTVDADHTRMAIVFQEPRLLPWLTVRENLALALPTRFTQREERIRLALDSVRLAQVEDKFARELSGGMAQRVAIARALLRQPKVLLMDEPFAALDAITRSDLQQMLISLVRQQHLTCLFVTHDLTEAALISDRLVVMQQGRIVASYEKADGQYPVSMLAELHRFLHCFGPSGFERSPNKLAAGPSTGT